LQRLLKFAFIAGIFVAFELWIISAPQTLEDSTEFARIGDVEKGFEIFYAGGCASCHTASKSKGEAKFLLTGGR